MKEITDEAVWEEIEGYVFIDSEGKRISPKDAVEIAEHLSVPLSKIENICILNDCEIRE